MVEIDLSDYEQRIFSQNGEDGVIEKIFQLIGFTNRYFVEFGVEHAIECNMRYTREHYGMDGLFMDCNFERPEINLHKEYLTRENINHIFEKYNVPTEFDVLSIDVDGNDLYLWLYLDNKYKPRLLIIEANCHFKPDEDKCIKYESDFKWDLTWYQGATPVALNNGAVLKGYVPIYIDNNGVNMFFLRYDICVDLVKKGIVFKNYGSPTRLFKPLKDTTHLECNEKHKWVTSHQVILEWMETIR